MGPTLTTSNSVPVTIYNTSTNPVEVVSVGPNQPYVDEVQGNFTTGATSGTAANFAGMGLTVPAGKRLVLDNISGYTYLFGGGNATYQVLIGLTINSYVFFYPFNYSPANGALLSSFNQTVKLTADPGSTMSFLFYSNIGVESATTLEVQLVGHYINDP